VRIYVMVKKKDYFGAIITGTIWTIICLALSAGVWWLVKSTTSNSIASYILPIICFCLGIYHGREFYKVELRTVRKNDPKTNWWGILDNVQMLLLAGIYINSINVFNEGFTWAGLGVFICGLLFVWIMVYMKNTRFPK